MTTYGVTPQGFVIKPYSVIQAELTAKVLSTINPGLDVSPDQPLGQLIGIFAEELAEVWELAQVAYNATNRGDAEGQLLANIGGITGTDKEPQSPSKVACALGFSAAGSHAAGALQAYIAGAPGQQWSNAVAITVPSTGGDGATPIGARNTWPCLSGANATLTVTSEVMTLSIPVGGPAFTPALLAGVGITIAGAASAGNNGLFEELIFVNATSFSWTNPDGATDANNGTIEWVLGSGTTFQFESSVDGPTYGDALIAANLVAYGTGDSEGYGQLNQLVPVTGWTAIADVGGVTLGTFEEEDTPYRVRQYQELSAPGSCTLDAIEAAILTALATVPVAGASVEMFENTTLVTDANGLPGKSYMAVVYDGLNPNQTQNDQLIAGAIWTNKPAGMQAYGTHPVTYLDSLGVERTVPFTRPAGVPIYLAITLAVAPGLSAAQQNAIGNAVALALVDASQGEPFTLYGGTITPQEGASTTFVPGGDVVQSALKAIAQGQLGVRDVPQLFLGTAPAPASSANLGFPLTQVATLNAQNIAFTYTTLSP